MVGGSDETFIWNDFILGSGAVGGCRTDIPDWGSWESASTYLRVDAALKFEYKLVVLTGDNIDLHVFTRGPKEANILLIGLKSAVELMFDCGLSSDGLVLGSIHFNLLN